MRNHMALGLHQTLRFSDYAEISVRLLEQWWGIDRIVLTIAAH